MAYEKTPAPDPDVAQLLQLVSSARKPALRDTLETIKAEKPAGWSAVKQFLPMANGLGLDPDNISQAAHMLADEPHGEFAHCCSEQNLEAARDVLQKKGWMEMDGMDMD
jgi:hypothetical protein